MSDQVVCSFCGERQWVNRRVNRTWNVVFHEGVAVGVVCPGCQTPEENAEAEIREATTDLYLGPDGRAYGRAKA